ncbi:hypothetical protein EE612_054214, partial [Oryza sativa]
ASTTTTTTHLHFYMHDAYTGPAPTAMRVVSGRSLAAAAVRRHRGAEQRADGGAIRRQRARGHGAGVRGAGVGGRRGVGPEPAHGAGGRRAPRQLGDGEGPHRHGRRRARVGGDRRHGAVPARARVHGHQELRLQPRHRWHRRDRPLPEALA